MRGITNRVGALAFLLALQAVGGCELDDQLPGVWSISTWSITNQAFIDGELVVTDSIEVTDAGTLEFVARAENDDVEICDERGAGVRPEELITCDGTGTSTLTKLLGAPPTDLDQPSVAAFKWAAVRSTVTQLFLFADEEVLRMNYLLAEQGTNQIVFENRVRPLPDGESGEVLTTLTLSR